MEEIQTPVIPVVASLIKATPGTISLGQGVVYYGPPENAFTKLQAITRDAEIHRYSHTAGLSELRTLISQKLSNENHITVPDDRIVVTAGSNMAFLNALFAITRPGDEIILVVPYYFNHEMAIRMLGCVPILVESGTDYLPDIGRLRSAITPKTRAIVTISPNNPAGKVYPQTLLKDINLLCRNHNIYHISDEAYEYFTYGDNQHFSPGSLDDAGNYTISLYSLSKSYGFANWRIGYMVLPEQLIEAVYKAQDTNLICPAIASQYAAIGALETGKAYCLEKNRLIAEIRDILIKNLTKVVQFVDISNAEGAFYLLLKIHTDATDMDVVTRLIKDYQVATLPGGTFGLDYGCFLRVAYGALDKNNATEGIHRLCHGLTEIVKKA